MTLPPFRGLLPSPTDLRLSPAADPIVAARPAPATSTVCPPSKFVRGRDAASVALDVTRRAAAKATGVWESMPKFTIQAKEDCRVLAWRKPW